jgi:hypothetical protein
VPLAPVHARLNCVVLVSALEASLPEVALVPDQPPEAMHDVALVEDQVRVADPPLLTDSGLAVRDTVGAGVAVTVTVADAFCVPPAPVQDRLNVLVLVSAPVEPLPDVALAPDQPPEAAHDVAFVEDHVSVDDPPLATDCGLAVRDTVGAGVAVTVTVADALCVPPGPVQERLKLLVLLNAPVDALPEVALAPDQPPEAVQDVALVEDHVRIDDPPLATDVGFAEIETVGTGGGSGVPVTLTCVEALPLPFGPLQVREKLLLVLSAPVDWLPEVPLVPDHAPVAEQEVAFVELHVSIETPPFATDVGFAPRDTDGPDAAGDSSPAPPHAARMNPAVISRPLAFKIAPNSLNNATKNVHRPSANLFWRRPSRVGAYCL